MNVSMIFDIPLVSERVQVGTYQVIDHLYEEPVSLYIESKSAFLCYD